MTSLAVIEDPNNCRFYIGVRDRSNSYIIFLFYAALNLRNPLRQRTKNI